MTGAAVTGFGGILYKAMHISERMARLVAFMDLEAHKRCLRLSAVGRLEGARLGWLVRTRVGRERREDVCTSRMRTPISSFPIIGEELGLRATLLVVLRFLALTLSGIMIALQARDRFGMLLGFGLVMNIGLQACVNIGMTTALLPNKGCRCPSSATAARTFACVCCSPGSC